MADVCHAERAIRRTVLECARKRESVGFSAREDRRAACAAQSFLYVHTTNANRLFALRGVLFHLRDSSTSAIDDSYFRDEIFRCLVFGTSLELRHENTCIHIAYIRPRVSGCSLSDHPACCWVALLRRSTHRLSGVPFSTGYSASDIRDGSSCARGFPMMFLLDVNALLAIQYPKHVHHARVRAWLSALHAERGQDDVVFATCPIIELGFVRVGSGPAGFAVSVDASRADLRELKSRENMLFIPDNIPARDLPDWVCKPAQTTDGYLLALAKSHCGHLATLDRFIPGAVFIPDETPAPLAVREKGALAGWAAPLRTGAQPDPALWQ
jgi:predicted nucleic acid-binding protein